MSEKNDVLVQVDHLKKYFPVKGLKLSLIHISEPTRP